MEAPFSARHPVLKDIWGMFIFLVLVLVGTLLINQFVFRSFNVLGPSMEPTLHTGDRLIVNRLPVTWSLLKNEKYLPDRGEIIVFRNPQYTPGSADEYIVKRVIAFAGERVTVKDGVLTVYNRQNPDGFLPDNDNGGEPGSPTSGDVDTVVSEGTIFVSGDHREGDYSYDSRNGLGLIPLYDIVGPVGLRIFPVDKIRTF
jgi:signal peptidase I